MGCNSSKHMQPSTIDSDGAGTTARIPAVAETKVGDDVSKQEELLSIASKTRRRGKNVFAESLDVDATNFVQRSIPKSPRSVAIINTALNSNFIFSSLSDHEKTDFVAAMEEKHVASGEFIIRQGDAGDYYYAVESGSFSFIVDNKVVGTAREGAGFGELALLYNTPRQASVRAESACVVWALDRLTFRFTLANASSQQRRDIGRALAVVPLLEGLTPEQLQTIADAVNVIKFEAGHSIIKKGQEGNIFYMIKEGSVRVTDVGSNNQFADHDLTAGDYFGERALITGEPRAANVTASGTGPAILMALDRESFNSLLGPLREVLDYNLNIRVIKGVKLLQALTDNERNRIIPSFQLISYGPNESIISEGDNGDSFFIIKSGRVVVDRMDRASGRSIQIAELGIGDYFGEMALLRQEPRQASVRSKEICEFFVLSRSNFTMILGPLQLILDRTSQERMDEVAARVAESNRSAISFNDLNELAVLGTGTFGRVKLVQNKKSKDVYALKAMIKSEIVAHKQQKNIINERNVMLQSNHPFILRLFTTFKDNRRLYLLLEFVQGGELFTVLHTATRDGVPDNQAKFYGLGVFLGLEYLHQREIAYRDMKPENCLVDRDGYPKLVDFGFAKIIRQGTKSYTLCGTPEYLAPEIVLSRGHSKSVDHWAFGILLYEMEAGYSPFCDPASMDQVVICRNIVNAKLVFPRTFNEECKDLIKKLLVRDPTQRLRGGTNDIREHPWWRSIDIDAYYRKEILAPWVPEVRSTTDTSNFDPYALQEERDDGGHGPVDNSGWDNDF